MGRQFLVLVTALGIAFGGWTVRAADDLGPETAKILHLAAHGTEEEVRGALERIVAADMKSAIPVLIIGNRYRNVADDDYRRALKALTGHDGKDWFDWMLWQEAHPEIRPHPAYQDIKTSFMVRIDTGFLRFIGGSSWNMNSAAIRLEEVAWGGVRVDGIPPLENGPWIDAPAAGYLNSDDLVFGVEINGDARAYPLRILGWHEMANDVIGGVQVSLTYCTLCGAAILFEGKIDAVEEPLNFGTTGMLYRSNKLMYDRQTDSVWNQFTGEPVAGPLHDLVRAGTPVALTMRPVVTTTWEKWLTANPDTKVVNVNTGYQRDYGAGVVYRDYFASPDLMFPAAVDESRLKQKQRVFGIRSIGASKAWAIEVFNGEGSVVVNDAVGPDPVVLVGNADARSVRAFERKGYDFQSGPSDQTLLDGAGGVWAIAEDALTGPNGEKLGRLPGHLAFWFAWNSYYGTDSDLVTPEDL